MASFKTSVFRNATVTKNIGRRIAGKRVAKPKWHFIDGKDKVVCNRFMEEYYKKVGFDFANEPFHVAGDEFVKYYGKYFHKVELHKLAFEVIKKIRPLEPKYFIDWGGSLIWLQLDKINIKIFNDIRKIVNNAGGYLTVIKIEEDLKASVDIFSVDPIRYKISEKLKKSFDPKRILNPGKMYSGI